jgi:exopolysaccharide biosynthesis polyprenyl glycosylphosphotransferase
MPEVTRTRTRVPSRPELHAPTLAHVHPHLRVQGRARKTRRRHFQRAVRRIGLLGILDLSVLFGARSVLHALRDAPWSAPAIVPLFPSGFMGGWGSIAAFVVGLVFAGAYSSEERWASPLAVFRGVAVGAALGLWQSIDTVGMAWTGLHWILVWPTVGALLASVRAGLGVLVHRYRVVSKPSDRVILVGDPRSLAGKRAAEAVLRRPGMVSLGWLSERGDIEDYLGHPSAVWEVLCDTGTDTVVLCGDMETGVFDAVVEAAAVAGCRVLSIRPRGTLLAARPRSLGDGALRMLELTFPASRAGQDVLKRSFDALASVALLMLASPVLLLIALRIKLDSPGPVIFVQDRVGQAGRIFSMWKFRTMSDNADAKKSDVAHLNTTGDPRLFKIPNDPRVTKVGALLRRWSIDEMPQLWNVIRGDMSLVGPRPFFESDLAAYDDHHFIRLTVKPGMTGLWQVKGRSAIVDFEEVVDLDREYVEKWSFGLDLMILLATIPAVFRRTGAY